MDIVLNTNFQVRPNHGLKNIWDDVVFTLQQEALLVECWVHLDDFSECLGELSTLEHSPKQLCHLGMKSIGSEQRWQLQLCK